jgi:hypothetical protein
MSATQDKPRVFRRVGGGCMIRSDNPFPCDDDFDAADGTRITVTSTPDGHFSMPETIRSEEDLRGIGGVGEIKREPSPPPYWYLTSFTGKKFFRVHDQDWPNLRVARVEATKAMGMYKPRQKAKGMLVHVGRNRRTIKKLYWRGDGEWLETKPRGWGSGVRHRIVRG